MDVLKLGSLVLAAMLAAKLAAPVGMLTPVGWFLPFLELWVLSLVFFSASGLFLLFLPLGCFSRHFLNVSKKAASP